MGIADGAPAEGEPTDPDGAASELRDHLRGSVLLLAGRLLALAIEFAAHVVAVRYLTKGEYGAYSYALTVAGLVSSLLVLGLPETFARYAPMYLLRNQRGRLLGAAVMAVSIVGGVGLLAALAVLSLPGPTETALNSARAGELLAILMLAVPTDGINFIFQGLFAAIGRVRVIFFRQYVLVPALRFAVALVLVLADEDAAFLAFGYVAVSAIGVMWYAGYALPLLRAALRRTLDRIELPVREIMSFALPVVVTNAFWIVLLASSTVALGIMASTTEVAEFQAVLPPARLNYLVTTIFSILFIPTISRMFERGDLPGLRDTYHRTTYWLTVLTVPLLALTTVFAPSFVPAFFGGEYDDSIPILVLLSLGYYVHSTVGPNSTTLKVFRRLRTTVAIDVVALIGGLGLNLALIPVAGAEGAALAFLLAVTARNAAYMVALRRVAGIVLFTRTYLKLQLTIAATLAVLFAVELALPLGVVVVVILSTLAGLVVLRVTRDMLDVEHTFPELTRGRFGRFLRSSR